MNQQIIGQETTKREIDRIFNIFKTSQGVVKPHFILTGSSGSGKSHIIKTLCNKNELNFIEINSAQLTKEGTSGNSLSKALSPIMNYKDKLTVVFADEFDKLFISTNSNSSNANETTLGVQNEFLKVLENGTTSVFGDYGKYYEADLSKVLFIFAGAFNNEEDITLDKLRKFGVKTEFLGRVGLVYNTSTLTLQDLYDILEHHDLLKNYFRLFDNVNKEDVLQTIRAYLKENYENNTLGARIITTLIHQYFIKGGKLGDKEVKEITFQEKIAL